MIKIPAGTFTFRVHGIEIEGSNDIGVDTQMPWEDSPRRYHEHVLEMKPFWIDKYPVTNAEFKKFLDATHYHPKDDLNFLRDWHDGTFPDGAADKPVTWVSLEDARAYAAWAGKAPAARMGMAIRRARHRRPHLSVGQRVERRRRSDARSKPHDARTRQRERTSRRSEPVRRDGSGRQRLAVDRRIHRRSHARRHSCAAAATISRKDRCGISRRRTQLDEHGKLLLMAPSKDRAATLGFRCVRDAE